jgi:hypothetical protein
MPLALIPKRSGGSHVHSLILLAMTATLALACASPAALSPACEPEVVVVIDYMPIDCEESDAGTVCALQPGEEQVTFDATACATLALSGDGPGIDARGRERAPN